jgi:hypothetical protein
MTTWWTVLARLARSTTRASIGCPATSFRIFPGKRVLRMRAWMIATVFNASLVPFMK